MSPSPEPVMVWHTVVPQAWIDYNGHLTEGFYGVAFGEATDELLVHLGFGQEYRDRCGTFYTVETHIRFLREVRQGSTIATKSRVLGVDNKRLHLHHDLLVDEDPVPVATQEVMLLHVSQPADGGPPRTSSMHEPILGQSHTIAEAHATVASPDHVGRGIQNLR